MLFFIFPIKTSKIRIVTPFGYNITILPPFYTLLGVKSNSDLNEIAQKTTTFHCLSLCELCNSMVHEWRFSTVQVA